MTTSIEKMTKRNEFETKMVLNGEPTKVSVDVIEEDGRYYVQCIVDSNHFDGVDVLDQIRSWASAFGVELPIGNVTIGYKNPALMSDLVSEVSAILLDRKDVTTMVLQKHL
jgi:hypothetical protein